MQSCCPSSSLCFYLSNYPSILISISPYVTLFLVYPLSPLNIQYTESAYLYVWPYLVICNQLFKYGRDLCSGEPVCYIQLTTYCFLHWCLFLALTAFSVGLFHVSTVFSEKRNFTFFSPRFFSTFCCDLLLKERIFIPFEKQLKTPFSVFSQCCHFLLLLVSYSKFFKVSAYLVAHLWVSLPCLYVNATLSLIIKCVGICFFFVFYIFSFNTFWSFITPCLFVSVFCPQGKFLKFDNHIFMIVPLRQFHYYVVVFFFLMKI